MTPLRRKKTQEAIAAVDAGNYRQAETLLKPLWEEMPGDLEVFRVLQNCYLLQEKWEAAEHQIRTTGETLYGEDIQQDALLHLFLLKKDPGSALKVAAETIVTYPGFLDLYSDIGRQFKAAGYAEPFVAYMLAHLPEGRDKSLFLANHYAIVEQDYRQAMLYLQRILDEAPADAEALSYLDFLQKSEKSSLVAEARTQLSEGNTAEALPLYKSLLEMEPHSATAQEYYLCTLAAHYFFPFRWYFYKTNFMAYLPWIMKAAAYFFVMLAGVLYYKSGKPVDSPDHLVGPMLLFAVLVIPRYSLLPMTVQALSFRHAPGYHLLKKPVDFFAGVILLISWSYFISRVLDPQVKSFELFLPAAFMFHILNFQLAQQEEQVLLRKILLGYAVFALAVALLSWVNILPDGYKFFIFGSWLPIVLIHSLYSYYMEYRLKRKT